MCEKFDPAPITSYASDRVVTPGNRFALVVNVAPGLHIHVYAPGASYRVVKLHIEPQPNVRVLPIEFPPSEVYFFKPLNERVPVYQKPFTLLQEVVLDVTQEAEKAFNEKQELTLARTLEYQACDDKECFLPSSVPLRWTMKLARNPR